MATEPEPTPALASASLQPRYLTTTWHVPIHIHEKFGLLLDCTLHFRTAVIERLTVCPPALANYGKLRDICFWRWEREGWRVSDLVPGRAMLPSRTTAEIVEIRGVSRIDKEARAVSSPSLFGGI